MKGFFWGLAASVMLWVAPAFAGPGRWGGNGGMACFHEGKGGMGGGFGDRHLEALGLSGEQREKVVALHKEYDARFDALSDEMRALGRAARDARLAGKEVDAATAKRLEELRDQTSTLRSEMHAKMEALLTPEQRARFGASRPR